MTPYQYQFTIKSIEAHAATGAALVLPTAQQDATLRVRLLPVDAQTLASELAGIGTARSRLAQTCCRLVQELDGSLEGVELQRGAGNLVEAQLVVRTGAGSLQLPVAFSDGIALALANRLPVHGDSSLAPLLERADQQLDQRAPEDAVVAMPASFASFVNSLPDF
ncbi:MAG: hypothetical protein AVDCRST_MAG93-698 [uncultured Chloroflexia bacterium]|uniref:BFN domain-containing protein n=1 Tax=uncultured Chloroflexia bacterium TaxID=1672391 RepID=A0A6J4HL00_9CHLR|nr:MAG: hypothetical protein AVDCRST_MAG93-698 [uncultured Chloroflexia bacterium]